MKFLVKSCHSSRIFVFLLFQLFIYRICLCHFAGYTTIFWSIYVFFFLYIFGGKNVCYSRSPLHLSQDFIILQSLGYYLVSHLHMVLVSSIGILSNK